MSTSQEQRLHQINSYSKTLRKKINPKTKLGLALGALLSFATTSAMASENGFYVGLGITNTAAEEQGVNSSKFGLKLTGGYQFNPYFATELGLFNIGNHTKLGMKGNGISLSVLGQYPIYRGFNIFAELGAAMVNLEVDENNTTVDRTGENSLEDGKDPGSFIGFGVTYRINEWSAALKLTEIDTDADLTITSLHLYRYF